MTETRFQHDREGGPGPRSEYLMHQYVVRVREIGTGKGAAASMGRDRRDLDRDVQGSEHFSREYRLAMEDASRNRLIEDGVDCPNDCGPVRLWTRCPNCSLMIRGKRAA